MLLVHALPNVFVPEQFFRPREKTRIFILRVEPKHLVPRQTVAHEAGLVRVHDPWSLLIDAVEAPEDGIVHAAHVAGTGCEKIMLQSVSAIAIQIVIGQQCVACLFGLVHWRRDQSQWRICPWARFERLFRHVEPVYPQFWTALLLCESISGGGGLYTHKSTVFLWRGLWSQPKELGLTFGQTACPEATRALRAKKRKRARAHSRLMCLFWAI